MKKKIIYKFIKKYFSKTCFCSKYFLKKKYRKRLDRYSLIDNDIDNELMIQYRKDSINSTNIGFHNIDLEIEYRNELYIEYDHKDNNYDDVFY